MQRREGPVLPWREPAAALADWPADFTPAGGADPFALVQAILNRSHHLQHPRGLGHPCAAPLPLAALLGMVADLLNNSTASCELGPVATAMERALVQWLSGRVGFTPAQAGGLLTQGGSVGTLTALLAARQASLPADGREAGCQAGPELCLVASDQAHDAVRRAAEIMGLGGRQFIVIPTDAHYRMRTDLLEAALDQAAAQGRQVMAVVASAGSPATGAIDPLEAIAGLCEARNLWLHVDAAHSGAMVVSDRLRPALEGIARAHSVVIDTHRMLMMPSPATAVLFRHGDHADEACSKQASGLLAPAARPEGPHLEHWPQACGRPFLSLNLYVALQVLGTDAFARFVEGRHHLASRFAARIQSRPDWELAVPPEGTIVCFRYLPAGTPDGDALQATLRATLVQSGTFHLARTVLRDRTYLRTTLSNPLTTDADLETLLATVETVARLRQRR
jgi:L-2,4-diaminobutyrate decarboxylase